MRNPFARSRTVAPGLLLVMVGLLSALTNAVNVAHTLADREAFETKTREDYEGMAERANEPWIRDFGEFTVKWLPVAQYAFLAMGLTTMLGGIAMIRRRFHSLAMVGAVLSLFNVVNCCCVLGFPAGGWALFVLMNPEVRAQFFRPRASGTPEWSTARTRDYAS